MNGRGTRNRGAGIRSGVVVVVALLLAGCTPAAGFPAGLTEAEVRERTAAEATIWWESIAPGEPQPQVEPLAYESPDSRGEEANACVAAAGLEGVRETGGGFEITDPSPCTRTLPRPRRAATGRLHEVVDGNPYHGNRSRLARSWSPEVNYRISTGSITDAVTFYC